MQIYKKIFFFLTMSALTFLLTGCSFLKPVEIILKPEAPPQQNNAVSKRFEEAAPKGQTVVDSALELAKRNTKLSEETFATRQKNQELIAENSRLKEQLAVLEPELEQAKKELTEANDLLIEMRIELNNWKADILGYRAEMRDADKAQLGALLKILEFLSPQSKRCFLTRFITTKCRFDTEHFCVSARFL